MPTKLVRLAVAPCCKSRCTYGFSIDRLNYDQLGVEKSCCSIGPVTGQTMFMIRVLETTHDIDRDYSGGPKAEKDGNPRNCDMSALSRSV